MKQKFFLLILIPVLFFMSCAQIGLGEEVDLEAPVLSVTKIASGGTEITDTAIICGGGYTVVEAFHFSELLRIIRKLNP